MDRYTKERALKRRHSKSQTKSKKCRPAENLDFVAISAEFLDVIANDIRTSTNDTRYYSPFS